MVTRKRALRKPTRLKQVSKKHRKNSPALSDWSERTGTDAHDYEVNAPPPKAEVRTDLFLTFPMGSGQSALPYCEGPRLKPFSNGDVQVQFIKELGGNAIHSNVFEVNINDQPYALKLFRTFASFYNEYCEYWSYIWDTFPSSREAAYYFRPFYRECRAYARIQEKGLQDRYWKCYGYLKLPPSLRQQLCKVTGLPEYYWQLRPPEFGRWDKPTTTKTAELSWPIYGIVKELAPSSAAVLDTRTRSIRVMVNDLRQLHKAGIVNTDLADRNYIAGRIVDFSSSFTLPHIWFDKPRKGTCSGTLAYLNHQSFDGAASTDRMEFEEMIAEHGIKTRAINTFDSDPPYNTRARRALRSKWSDHMPPLYELGVNEPPPPGPFTDAVIRGPSSSWELSTPASGAALLQESRSNSGSSDTDIDHVGQDESSTELD